ncbi:polyketide synthase [Purpureocillium lavendulum]|uniref:Polyketide synthase n=1 Tax=Purpureocillium lavendulum TaxID=1247861 RepID=A0AB34G1B7_9HYPO|nr:polyketide synthase [Purpureocillium lavendulum]
MALNIDYEAVPGTEQLIDCNNKHEAEALAHAGQSDIVLIPQPSECSGDPLNWPKWKKHYQLFLVALYACAFSFGENTLGAAWTTVSKDTGVSLTNMNGGSALNYLLLGFVNIWWMPTANILGRRLVYLTTTALCLATGFWLAAVHGTAQWMLNMIVNGIGTSAYQAIVQLAIFDMFFVHERGRMLSVYLFAQQLGSIIGLITGGSMSDTVGWRWSQRICGLGFTVVLLMFFFSFEETLFPRFLFSQGAAPRVNRVPDTESSLPGRSTSKNELGETTQQVQSSVSAGQFPRRTYLETLKPWTRYPQNKTTFWQYFRRPFFLWGFPNVVIAGFIYAFGATAGIVSFNTISEILTEAPYNFSTTSTGLVFFAALVGNIVGWSIGVASDHVVIALSRRNGGVKEPEMRLYMLAPCFVLAAAGYMLYGWGAQTQAHWITVAIGIGAMISHQVGACTIATAYAMDCFPGRLLAISPLLLATNTVALTSTSSVHIQTCYEGETSALHCYNGEGDTPQDVSVDNVAHVAQALRDYGREVEGGRFLTMTAENSPDCAEWNIFAYQTVLALAKHIDPDVNTSVLYEDIATTIDGGPSASEEEKAKALIGCSTSGGSLGVLVNETDPSYHTDKYEESGYTPEGIIIKIVSNVRKDDL